ncbi:MAG: hypothetical protein A2W28_11090 [Gammaproteobacteria bacterium RBG_16_51_14]|nr:MAG: hypothetical protein A2W28_11090 [Gammaproteobacteria bacterium RBG_16_51_14]
MPKDYKNSGERNPAKPKTGNLLPFITGLVAGLLVAATVYFHEHKPVTEPVSAQDNGDTAAVEAKNQGIANEEKTKSLPELQFDFYKILPSKEVNISEWETREDEHPVAGGPSQEPVMYILQVGSFGRYDAADEVKARLAMLGISADIQRVVINGQDIRHRVRIGPYKDTVKLQEARDRLLANDLDFVLLKLKMDDISEPILPDLQPED